MINSFEIKNFRNLDGLSIKNIEKVNLFAGKNNTGKTNLLQAIELFVSDFNLGILTKQLINKRELNYKDYRSYRVNNEDLTFKNIEILKNLFSYNFFENYIFLINLKSNNHNLSVQLKNKENFIPLDHRFEILSIKFRNIEEEISLSLTKDLFRLSSEDTTINKIQFIETNEIEKNINALLWENLVFTGRDEEIINALKIIDINIENITFVGQNEKYAIAKLKNLNKPIPLKSMGDGINRILTIILSMVNVENGYFFIDEFENGLHYSVQKDLWKMIFYLAEKLNIQVFATTHSSDCINAFQEVINDSKIKIKGQYIRLENKNGEIREVAYTNEELNFASENDIETR